ncbi:nucleotide exchange factor GrpE [Candidatus Micrarchaeota archaeon]|nr:nucleotide exchange factor GrpE [Candidatus Micrarchaeota archaeon]
MADEPSKEKQPECESSSKFPPEHEQLMFKKQLIQLQADFENYKKRNTKETEFIRENAAANMVASLLPIIDEFELAFSHSHKAKSSDEHFHKGMELIYAKLLDLLKKESVEEMKVLGEKFDPYNHDALRQGEGDSGKVIEVIQKGYLFKGKVLRHAKVVVGGQQKTESENGHEKEVVM